MTARPWIATIVVTAVTLVLVGGVVAATTKAVCGPSNQFGLKMAQCVATKNTASRTTPEPIISTFPSAKPGAPPPTQNPVSSFPPNQGTTTTYPAPPPADGTMSTSGRSPQDPFISSYSAPSAPSLNCTLPVFAGPPGSGGFVSFPAGAFTADPRSAVAFPSPGPSYGPGYGYPNMGQTYDRAHSRWLPVPSQFVSPDGAHYAYATGSGIYVVDAANSSQVEVGEGHSWNILRVLNDHVVGGQLNAPGLWIVPFSGTASELVTTGYWQGATATAAYGTSTSAVPSGTTQTLQRADLATGKVTDWFSQKGASTGVFGFDAQGDPLIMANYTDGWELWLTKSPTSGYVVMNSYQQVSLQGQPVGDSHGIWFSLYLQGFDSGPEIALDVPGVGIYLLARIGAQIAGPCG